MKFTLEIGEQVLIALFTALGTTLAEHLCRGVTPTPQRVATEADESNRDDDEGVQ